MSPPRAVMIAAPASSSGKTTVALGLLRLLSRLGVSVRGAKSGPDYIDPMYHTAACGRPSVNLDAWSMSGPLIRDLAFHGASTHAPPETGGGDLLIVEGAMGAVDGAGHGGAGSTADLAELLDIPVVMIVDAAKAGHSCVLPVLGLQAARPGVHVAGFIAGRVASDRHAAQIRSAADQHRLTLFGTLRRRSGLALPSRHLGLVPAAENEELEEFLNASAGAVENDLDAAAVAAAARPLKNAVDARPGPAVPPLGQKISVAADEAFCFIYPHLLSDWRRAGAEIGFFSPLADEPPRKNCDAVYLPGGYPELHAPRLATAEQFRRGMRSAARGGAIIYGECGGYMALGRGLEDNHGNRHRMLELLGHSTTFRKPRLHLGYRQLKAGTGAPFSGCFAGHEFHYAAQAGEDEDRCLFSARDADGGPLPGMGGIRGRVCGSFAHLICARDPDQ